MRRWLWALTLSILCGMAVPAKTLPKPLTRTLQVDGRKVDYEVLDGGPGTPLLVLLSGTSGPQTRFYREQAELLQQSGFTVLRVGRPLRASRVKVVQQKHGLEDNNIPVSNAQQLQRLCVIDKLDCESHLYPGQGHGFTPGALEDANRRTVEFLKDRLR